MAILFFLSMHRHMIKANCFNEVTEIFKQICKKIKYKLFFCFSLPYEVYKGFEIFAVMPDMGKDPDKCIENYLKNVVYVEATLLAVFFHNLISVEKRNLFMGEK